MRARLGLPNLDALAPERFGRTGRWLGDLRTLARGLWQVPIVREAYLMGRLSTSKAELIARHLVRSRECEDEAQRHALGSANTMTLGHHLTVTGGAPTP